MISLTFVRIRVGKKSNFFQKNPNHWFFLNQDFWFKSRFESTFRNFLRKLVVKTHKCSEWRKMWFKCHQHIIYLVLSTCGLFWNSFLAMDLIFRTHFPLRDVWKYRVTKSKKLIGKSSTNAHFLLRTFMQKTIFPAFSVPSLFRSFEWTQLNVLKSLSRDPVDGEQAKIFRQIFDISCSWFGVSPNLHYEVGVGAPYRDL